MLMASFRVFLLSVASRLSLFLVFPDVPLIFQFCNNVLGLGLNIALFFVLSFGSVPFRDLLSVVSVDLVCGLYALPCAS